MCVSTSSGTSVFREKHCPSTYIYPSRCAHIHLLSITSFIVILEFIVRPSHHPVSKSLKTSLKSLSLLQIICNKHAFAGTALSPSCSLRRHQRLAQVNFNFSLKLNSKCRRRWGHSTAGPHIGTKQATTSSTTTPSYVPQKAASTNSKRSNSKT